MKLVAASLVLLVSIVGGLVAWFCGWIGISGTNNEQAGPAFAFDCVNAAGLQPCHCKQRWHDYVETNTLICPKLDNDLQLLSPLANTLQKYPQINAFQLENSALRFLPSEVFKGQNFGRIIIRQSTLTALSDSDIAFVGLELKLQFLSFTDVVLQSHWDWSIFRNLSSVKELEVFGGDIDTLGKVEDGNLLSPKKVIFDNNKITALHSEVFKNFQNLVFFKFRNNLVKTIKRTMFPIPASKLEQLHLGYNEIESLPDDMFIDMPVLKTIALERNKILTLNEKAFKPVLNHIKFIDVHMNDLECDCRLLWIVGLRNNLNQHPFLLYGTCAEPPKLRGRDLQNLKSEELYC